ncbi:GDSL-type esterase/lipase family protein [Flavobacterium sp. SM15]|uniref:GDSL-type esterase/lipase family protein n=1 Tax=Flavobacterium sp. SM15 TaxID=2908005 RepID=UPI001EDAC1ED|nr:GDSL-type esterase/lipase family protein [Flavobacterium sp. SM15]MCG2611980.1 GDSL-type esterase/lipase family protein [Flavobacterium sp. SM15]
MKKVLSFLLIYCSCLQIVAQSTKYDTLQYSKEHHQNRLITFKSEPIEKNQIIFLGNSITEFGNWQELLHDKTILNRGIAGDNTFGVLKRLNEITEREPNKLFLKIGINDISQNIPADVILENISAIIVKIKEQSPKTKIFIQSILPTNKNSKNVFPDAYNKNEVVALINASLKKTAKKNNATYIDINSLLKDSNGELDTKYANTDGLHLNELGYKTWAEFLKKKKYL